MNYIKLAPSKFGEMFALVDDYDYEYLYKYNWRADKKRNTFYAVIDDVDDNGKRITVFMHRVIMKTRKGMQVDHKDGNGLNNQRINLRNVTHAENQRNKGKLRNNTSGYKGVSWSKQNKKWQVQIKLNGKGIRVGQFSSKEDAYEAYCAACIKFHGEFAKF